MPVSDTPNTCRVWPSVRKWPWKRETKVIQIGQILRLQKSVVQTRNCCPIRDTKPSATIILVILFSVLRLDSCKFIAQFLIVLFVRTGNRVPRNYWPVYKYRFNCVTFLVVYCTGQIGTKNTNRIRSSARRKHKKYMIVGNLRTTQIQSQTADIMMPNSHRNVNKTNKNNSHKNKWIKTIIASISKQTDTL